jgi:hypothetical protein
MWLTSLQKCDRALWQMLFHPTALTFEFCDPLAFEQMCISCFHCALTGCNVTHNSISSWLVQRDPPLSCPLHTISLSIPTSAVKNLELLKIRTNAPQIDMISFTTLYLDKKIIIIYVYIMSQLLNSFNLFKTKIIDCWHVLNIKFWEENFK